jgi:multiple sugar transport system permease protein
MTRQIAALPVARSARLGVRTRALLSALCKHGILLFFSVFFILPWFWMITTSLKTQAQIVEIPIRWIPNPIYWQNYPNAFFRDPNQPLLLYIQNSLYVCVLSVVGAVLSNTMVAYGFSRIQWPGRDIVFIIVLATLMLPFPVVMIPLYLFWRNVQLTNTYWPLILPTWLASPYFIFLLRQFFLTIPQDLSDAARIDGASEMRILWQVMVPLAIPAIAVVALFQFIGSWNDFLGPLIYLQDKTKFTIALGLRNMQNAYGLSNFGEIMAATTVTILPIIVIFFLAQRTFIQGITFSGLKG